MGQAILLTGAAGFIGSHAAEALLRAGHRVIGIDNFNDYYDPEQKRANAELLARAGVELIEGDIRDQSLIEQLFQSYCPQTVVHLAAMAGVRASVDAPELYYDVNLNGTLCLLEAARRHRAPRFVFASTSSAYGLTERLPFDESDHADRPLAPYPASKRSAELLGHAYHHAHGMNFTALRFFTVYGPRNRPDMLPAIVMRAITQDESLPLYNHGEMRRDWTYVGDIVRGIVAATERSLGYEIINLGRGAPVHIRDFVNELAALAGKSPQLELLPMPPADVPITFASIDKARRLLGYHPETSLQEGVRAFYQWYQQAHPK